MKTCVEITNLQKQIYLKSSYFKRYKPSAKSLKMDTVIYADFESILVPYSTCDKKHETCKNVNQQVPCGYSINVYTYKVYIEKHQSNIVIAVKMLLVIFLKKMRNITYDFTNIYKQSMIDLTEREINEYENAKYCHICKKVFGKAKKHRKVRDHDHYTGKLRGAT